jgi:1,2-diacylglycerol 3-alpha-glucosyltransferase
MNMYKDNEEQDEGEGFLECGHASFYRIKTPIANKRMKSVFTYKNNKLFGGAEMKILITTDTYYPMTNGVVISTDNLYKQLKLLGHEVKILALSADGKEHVEGDIFCFSSYNINVYPEAKIIRPRKSSIIRGIIKWRPDIIHSQSEFSTMVIAKYIRKKLNIPQVHTYHTLYEDYLHYFPGGKTIKKTALSKLTGLLLNTFDTVIAPTEKVKEKLESYQVGTNIEIVPTGISLDKFQSEISLSEKDELLSRYGLSRNDNILLYVGRIAEEKNIGEVLKFYNKALGYIENTKLLIVGGGPYLSKLKEIASQYGIESDVKFTGMVSNEEIHKYYKLGDAFITASTSETQGITYIEALASGLPVICRFDKCIENIVVNGETGFTYENEEEFINALVNITTDSQLRKNLSSNVQNKVKDYSVENFGLRILSIYNNLLVEQGVHCSA